MFQGLPAHFQYFTVFYFMYMLTCLACLICENIRMSWNKFGKENEHILFSRLFLFLLFAEKFSCWHKTVTNKRCRGIRCWCWCIELILILLISCERVFSFVYNPVNDSIFNIPNLPARVQNLIWDSNPYDKGIFVVHDETTIYTYIFCREAIRGRLKIGYIYILSITRRHSLDHCNVGTLSTFQNQI